MAALGHEDGKTVVIEYRYGEGKLDQLPSILRNLVEQDSKVIVAVAGEALVAAAQVTKSVPIVSATAGGDFVSRGCNVGANPRCISSLPRRPGAAYKARSGTGHPASSRA
jgi:ABC-type uncharacterized transport system substrate-binding protein